MLTALSKTFTFQGKEYRYFFHHYNMTWRNERAVEIPVVYPYLKCALPSNTMELGNVLSYYFKVSHAVVDRDEKKNGNINVDIVDYAPGRTYDLIISISTLEHVGWDECPKAPHKVFTAFCKLESLLNRGGKMVVTFPLAYNPVFDRLIRDGIITFTKEYFMKRTSKDNRWVETDKDDAMKAEYGNPYKFGNALMIGVLCK